MTDEERREMLIDAGEVELAKLRVKQEAFDRAIVEVQTEDLETFLMRI